MTVLLFRNYLNREMKRFGKFLKRIEQSRDSSDENDFRLIFSPYVKDYYQALKENDTIIVVAHGSHDALFHKYDFKNKNHQILFDGNNLDLLSNNKIIAFSCGTATSLGKLATSGKHCEVYLGLKHRLHFDKKNGNNCSGEYHQYLVNLYSKVFEEITTQAIENKWSFKKFERVLSLELRSTVMKTSDVLKKSDSFYHIDSKVQAILAVTNVAANIDILGNENACVC